MPAPNRRATTHKAPVAKINTADTPLPETTMDEAESIFMPQVNHKVTKPKPKAPVARSTATAAPVALDEAEKQLMQSVQKKYAISETTTSMSEPTSSVVPPSSTPSAGDVVGRSIEVVEVVEKKKGRARRVSDPESLVQVSSVTVVAASAPSVKRVIVKTKSDAQLAKEKANAEKLARRQAALNAKLAGANNTARQSHNSDRSMERPQQSTRPVAQMLPDPSPAPQQRPGSDTAGHEDIPKISVETSKHSAALSSSTSPSSHRGSTNTTNSEAYTSDTSRESSTKRPTRKRNRRIIEDDEEEDALFPTNKATNPNPALSTTKPPTKHAADSGVPPSSITTERGSTASAKRRRTKDEHDQPSNKRLRSSISESASPMEQSTESAVPPPAATSARSSTKRKRADEEVDEDSAKRRFAEAELRPVAGKRKRTTTTIIDPVPVPQTGDPEDEPLVKRLRRRKMKAGAYKTALMEKKAGEAGSEGVKAPLERKRNREDDDDETTAKRRFAEEEGLVEVPKQVLGKRLGDDPVESGQEGVGRRVKKARRA